MLLSDRSIRGRRILVLENEYLIAVNLKSWLQEAGAEVLGPVPDVARAFDLIEAHHVDAAVLDVNLGGGATGYRVADVLRALGVPFLFASGDSAHIASSTYRQHLWLAKPYGESQLVEAVQSLLFH